LKSLELVTSPSPRNAVGSTVLYAIFNYSV
jgi:hypothetical protein